MSGSSLSSTPTPQITPVMSLRGGFNAGAWSKNASNVCPLSNASCKLASSCPVNQHISSSY